MKGEEKNKEAPEDDLLGKLGGGARGVVLALARKFTRPAQMRLFIWLAKRRWAKRTSSPADRSVLVTSVAIESAIGMALYNTYDTALVRSSQVIDHPDLRAFSAGAVAGVVNAMLSTPHDNLIKVHAETLKSAGRAFRLHEIELFGPKGLWKGVTMAVCRDSMAMGVMFSATGMWKRALPQPHPDSLVAGAAHSFVAGGLAGMCSTVAAMPFRNAAMWNTHYPGTYFFTLAPRMAASTHLASLPKTLFAGAGPAMLAAFLPNALGMSVGYLATRLL